MEHHPLPFEQLLEQNNLGVIENPLRRIPEREVEAYITALHRENNLGTVVDLTTLLRGMRLARDPEAFTAREIAQGTLTEVETAALKREEHPSIWTETRELKIIIFNCSIGSITQGWAQGAIVAANQIWPKVFGFKELSQNGSTKLAGSDSEIWRFAVTNAIVYFAASSVGAFLCDPLTEIFSGTALGIAISGAISLIAPGSWRFQISSSFIPAFALLLLVYMGSESPRWLIKKQRYAEAYIGLSRLRGSPLLAARDLVFIWTQLRVETILFMRTNKDIIDLEHRIPYLDPQVYRREIGLLGYGRRISQLFTIPRARRATIASFLVMTAQQMTGINIFAFLAATLFESGKPNPDKSKMDSGNLEENPDRTSLWLFFGFGIANFLSSMIAYRYIDRKGRRWLLMSSLVAIFPFLLATALSFLAEAGTPQQSGLIAFFLIVYTIVTTLRFFHILILRSGLDVIALFLVWLFVPGTERQIATMEEMNYVFGVALRRHVNYQIKKVAPWCVEHYIRRRRGVDLDPLYHWVHARQTTNDTRGQEA
ncbi:MAG: hypothetical protein Q9224_004096 [Gallowayella concinna]